MSGDSPRISANVGGHAGWAYLRYREITGKSPAVVLTELIEYWTEQHPKAASLGLTLDDYRQSQGGELVSFADQAQKKAR
jgi:hypothetical protein